MLLDHIKVHSIQLTWACRGAADFRLQTSLTHTHTHEDVELFHHTWSAALKKLSAQALKQYRVNANRGPWWQLFARAPLLTRDKDLSQPATRVDTTCWQLFRPDINTAHFLFFVAEVTSNYLTTDGLKKFSLLPEAPLGPETRGICHICHMVNPTLH